MLEGVTLGSVVQLVVQVLVDLAGSTVLDQQAAENSLTAHPEDLPIIHYVSQKLFLPNTDTICIRGRSSQFLSCIIRISFLNPISFQGSCLRYIGISGCGVGIDILRHTGIGGTLSLSETTVTTDPTGQVQLAGTGTGVHGDGLSDDEAIGDKLADRLAGVGVGNLVNLVGVEPDLALAAAEDISREALLSSQVDPVEQRIDKSALHFSTLKTRS